MRAERRSRMPMLGEEGRLKFIVDESLIDEFVGEQVVHGDRDVKTLTVDELLADPCGATPTARRWLSLGPRPTWTPCGRR